MATSGVERVVVIGAGIAGLTAACRLAQAGIRATVFDKARGVGGRMATRRIGKGRLDHGAQYFTATDPQFEELVAELRAAGAAQPQAEWSGEGRLQFIGPHGMTDVPKHLARGIDVRLDERVASVERTAAGFRIRSERGAVADVDGVLLTAPVPQSRALLENGGIVLPEEVVARLEAVAYEPCFAVMATLSAPSRVPEPGYQRFEEGPIAFLADNQRKGISPGTPSVTIHASHLFTRLNLDRDRDEVGAELLDAARPWLAGEVTEIRVHRWLYGRAVPAAGPRYLAVDEPGPLAFAGDGFSGPRVEDAALSGLEAAEWLAGESVVYPGTSRFREALEG